MKQMTADLLGGLRQCAVTAVALVLAGASALPASYEWTFDNSDLSISLGNGTMAYADAETVTLTSFGLTDGTTVPHIGGLPATYMRVPILPNIGNGYLLTFNDTAPNGGGLYVNQYTVLFDILRPTPLGTYAAFLQTNPGNPAGNDADFYLHPNGGIGIGSGGYSSAGTVAQNTWYRIAFVLDGANNALRFFVNGNQVHTRSGGGLDGRWSLYSNQDPGPDLLLFNEGDTSGNYTGDWFVNSIAFVDYSLTAAELLALGGPRSEGILVPEPSSAGLTMLGLGAFAAFRLRRRTAV